MSSEGRWFLRIIERADGGWECRRGRESLDLHGDYGTAFGHIQDIAAGLAPAAVYAHWLDGRVEEVADFPVVVD